MRNKRVRQRIISHLSLLHWHVAHPSDAVDTLGDPPHPLSWPHPLDKVSGEEAHPVSALPLKYTGCMQ